MGRGFAPAPRHLERSVQHHRTRALRGPRRLRRGRPGHAVGWSVPRGGARPVPPRLPEPAVATATTGDGRVLAVADRDRAVRVWRLDTGERIATVREGTGAVRQLALTPTAARSPSAPATAPSAYGTSPATAPPLSYAEHGA
ncbi:hypothetical protein NKH77_08295 [Streptomyces sp. M19]